MSNLKDLVPAVEGETPVKKTFKDYEPGFVHVDIKYLPQMPDDAYFSPSWTAFQADRGRDFSVIVDGVSV